jgi:hypothetical protein
VSKNASSLKSGKKNGHFAWRPVYIDGNMALNCF